MGSVSDLRDTALGDAQNTRGVPLQEQNQAADLSSGTPNYVATGGFGGAGYAAWSPDGRCAASCLRAACCHATGRLLAAGPHRSCRQLRDVLRKVGCVSHRRSAAGCVRAVCSLASAVRMKAREDFVWGGRLEYNGGGIESDSSGHARGSY